MIVTGAGSDPRIAKKTSFSRGANVKGKVEGKSCPENTERRQDVPGGGRNLGPSDAFKNHTRVKKKV
jgi:hypothetical protein